MVQVDMLDTTSQEEVEDWATPGLEHISVVFQELTSSSSGPTPNPPLHCRGPMSLESPAAQLLNLFFLLQVITQNRSSSQGTLSPQSPLSPHVLPTHFHLIVSITAFKENHSTRSVSDLSGHARVDRRGKGFWRYAY